MNPFSVVRSGVNQALQAEQDSAVSLPPEFDPAVYRSRYADLCELSDAALEQHYRTIGMREGRNASRVVSRTAFIDLIPRSTSLLEIGPFANPLRRGRNVKYFDVLSTDDLRHRATKHGLDPSKCPRIDFVSETGDFAAVTERFDAVLSSHVIEHQPDLIRHLHGVASVLEPAGRFYLAVPDKRYCFDHFLAESSIADVVAAHVHEAKVHDVASVIEHFALTTHNDRLRHWAGDHGEPVYKATPTRIREVAELFVGSGGKYIDVHAWQFVPESFRDLAQTLLGLRLSAFRVLRVYATMPASNEFYAVLEKTAQPCIPLGRELPAEFDEQQYLLANPDVARAGANATEHYLSFGRLEGRKLRP